MASTDETPVTPTGAAVPEAALTEAATQPTPAPEAAPTGATPAEERGTPSPGSPDHPAGTSSISCGEGDVHG